MGLAMIGWIPTGRIFGERYHPGSIISKGFSRLSRVKSSAVYFPLGLWLGLLPCGPVYTALIGAARAGMEASTTVEGVVIGMGLMMAFGAGTIPALILVAKLADLGWLKSRQIIYKFSAFIMILMGIFFVIKAIRY
jgi:sulfite exporter TauE/SafE